MDEMNINNMILECWNNPASPLYSMLKYPSGIGLLKELPETINSSYYKDNTIIMIDSNISPFVLEVLVKSSFSVFLGCLVIKSEYEEKYLEYLKFADWKDISNLFYNWITEKINFSKIREEINKTEWNERSYSWSVQWGDDYEIATVGYYGNENAKGTVAIIYNLKTLNNWIKMIEKDETYLSLRPKKGD